MLMEGWRAQVTHLLAPRVLLSQGGDAHWPGPGEDGERVVNTLRRLHRTVESLRAKGPPRDEVDEWQWAGAICLLSEIGPGARGLWREVMEEAYEAAGKEQPGSVVGDERTYAERLKLGLAWTGAEKEAARVMGPARRDIRQALAGGGSGEGAAASAASKRETLAKLRGLFDEARWGEGVRELGIGGWTMALARALGQGREAGVALSREERLINRLKGAVVGLRG